KRVLRVVDLAEDAAADAEDEALVPPHEQLEGGLVAAAEEAVEEVRVAHAAVAAGRDGAKPRQDLPELATGHELRTPNISRYSNREGRGASVSRTGGGEAMTEAEWLTCSDPHKMLVWLHERGRLTERKARLFAVACSWKVANSLDDDAFFA